MENVKTFLRLLVIISVGSAVSSGIVSIDTGYELTLKRDTFYFHEFLKSSWITIEGPSYFSGAVLVAIYEFIFYPLLRRSLSCIQSFHWKVPGTMCLLLFYFVPLCTSPKLASYNIQYYYDMGTNSTNNRLVS